MFPKLQAHRYVCQQDQQNGAIPATFHRASSLAMVLRQMPCELQSLHG
uniref:Uncharacterized protein n=1 Tax=Rhizophora mucronata TaxID=61149 RepID=A0A2P2NTG4_RHIMU